MDNFGNTTSGHHSADEHDVPVEALLVARAIGRSLSGPLTGGRRDALLAELVTATSDTRVSGASDRVATGVPRRAGAAGTAGGGITPRGSDRPSSGAGRSRSRRALVVLSSVVILAAVGGTSSVLLRGGDDLPIVLLTSGAPGAAAGMASAPLRSGAEVGMDTMMWTPTLHRFVLAEGVGYPAGAAPAWRLVPPSDLAAGAARLAAIVGLPVPTTAEWDPTALQSSTDDGAGLWIGPSGDWYFHGPHDASLVWDCPTPPVDAGPDTPVSSLPYVDAPCTPPAAPSGVPSEARARELAVAFLARVGHPQVRITDVYADEWGAWVSAEPVVEGLPRGSGLAVSVGFGGAERVTSANGTLATVERVGEYPTIDAVAAIARLEADLSAWLTEGGPVARPLPAEDAPVTILPVPEPAPEPGTSGPAPEPVERTVTIVRVELVTSLSWTADGATLLMPHYQLTDSEGGWWSVVAVADRYVSR